MAPPSRVFSLLSRVLLLLLPLLLNLSDSARPTRPAGTPLSGNLSAYEALKSYNFPRGLLPKGVLGYDLDEDTGGFSVRLNGSCSFSLRDSYQLRYKSTVSGYISQNRLRELDGVSVKVLFFWVNIIEITRKSDDLTFSVGIASADIAVDSFLESPQCGCGFDCLILMPLAEESARLKLMKASS